MALDHSMKPPSLWASLALAILPIVAVLLLGRLATVPNLDPWYSGLAKPAFTPPNWVPGPVWGVLYILMAFAVWRILRLPPSTPGRTVALAVFFAQLALNVLWSWLFFGLQSPGAGLLNIIPQELLILATIDRFRRLDTIAAASLVPLAAWVAFAALLNFEIWRLNA